MVWLDQLSLGGGFAVGWGHRRYIIMTEKHLEEAMAEILDDLGGGYKAQYKFHSIRRWLLDFAFLAEKVGIEVQGGIWTGGRHTRGAGFEGDRHKINEAQLHGWLVLEVTPTMITDGMAKEYVMRALTSRRES